MGKTMEIMSVVTFEAIANRMTTKLKNDYDGL